MLTGVDYKDSNKEDILKEQIGGKRPDKISEEKTSIFVE